MSFFSFRAGGVAASLSKFFSLRMTPVPEHMVFSMGGKNWPRQMSDGTGNPFFTFNGKVFTKNFPIGPATSASISRSLLARATDPIRFHEQILSPTMIPHKSTELSNLTQRITTPEQKTAFYHALWSTAIGHAQGGENSSSDLAWVSTTDIDRSAQFSTLFRSIYPYNPTLMPSNFLVSPFDVISSKNPTPEEDHPNREEALLNAIREQETSSMVGILNSSIPFNIDGINLIDAEVFYGTINANPYYIDPYIITHHKAPKELRALFEVNASMQYIFSISEFAHKFLSGKENAIPQKYNIALQKIHDIINLLNQMQYQMYWDFCKEYSEKNMAITQDDMVDKESQKIKENILTTMESMENIYKELKKEAPDLEKIYNNVSLVLDKIGVGIQTTDGKNLGIPNAPSPSNEPPYNYDQLPASTTTIPPDITEGKIAMAIEESIFNAVFNFILDDQSKNKELISNIYNDTQLSLTNLRFKSPESILTIDLEKVKEALLAGAVSWASTSQEEKAFHELSRMKGIINQANGILANARIDYVNTAINNALILTLKLSIAKTLKENKSESISPSLQGFITLMMSDNDLKEDTKKTIQSLLKDQEEKIAYGEIQGLLALHSTPKDSHMHQ